MSVRAMGVAPPPSFLLQNVGHSPSSGDFSCVFVGATARASPTPPEKKPLLSHFLINDALN